MDKQRTDEWFAARLGKVTASRISDVMMKPTTAGYQNYMAQLVCERLTGVHEEGFTSAAMQHGIDTEPQARAMYEMRHGVDVDETGLVDHPTVAMSGASPDGLVGTDGLIEIKCPNAATHIKTLTGGKIDRKYLLQMQWQMACTGRVWCDFVSFCPAMPSEMQMYVQRVALDTALVAEIVEAVDLFTGAVAATVADLQGRYGQAA